ncbi:NicO-domain-containing protein [Aureobasidium sp. EXF-8845]|nr:NicO-domain-containing protein [Aureobasidium sp. EXF-8845]KAI4852610.1 NicO-domain-containing protein [Aureobasidium sp. EXF-8846]
MVTARPAEALQDANWMPKSEEDLQATGVYIGSGIGSLDDAYNTAVEFEKGGYKKVSPLFVPRLLINLAAGHISMRYGFKELEHAKARGASIYAEVRGYGLSSDAHHMTAPREDGQGPYLAMKRALKQAGIKPGSVDYVNAHATSTVLGDAAENRAIKTLLLGEEGYMNAGEVNISSTKGAVGHLLGAAGAVETIFTVLALQNRKVTMCKSLYPIALDDEGSKNAIYLRLKTRSQYYHAKIPVLKRLPFPSIAIIALLVVVNIVVWIVVGIVLSYHTIVVITSIVVASTAAAVSTRFGAFSRVGGIIGSSVSATFLIVLGIMNVFILYKLIKQLRVIINSPADAPEAEFQIEGGGCLFRVLKRTFKLIDRPWKMYPLGVLFGLGFDTSSEIALLGISAISASQGTSIWLILIFPVLFTSAKDSIAVLYYQAVLTGVTVLVAVVIGVIQFLGMLQGAADLEGGFWDGVIVASDNYDIIGGAICGSFVVFGVGSAILYRPWRKRVDAKRNALMRPYEEDQDDMGGIHGEPQIVLEELSAPQVRSDRKGDVVV